MNAQELARQLNEHELIEVNGADKRWWDYRELVQTSSARWRFGMVILMVSPRFEPSQCVVDDKSFPNREYSVNFQETDSVTSTPKFMLQSVTTIINSSF